LDYVESNVLQNGGIFMKSIQNASKSFLIGLLFTSATLLNSNNLDAKKTADSSINATFINTTNTSLKVRVISVGIYPNAIPYTSYENMIAAGANLTLPQDIRVLFNPELIGASHTCEILGDGNKVLYIIENKDLAGNVAIELGTNKYDVRM